jgi:hypothetical protein
MPNDDVKDAEVVVDTDALQLYALASGCPSGNIYDGNTSQPTRQGIRSQAELKGE